MEAFFAKPCKPHRRDTRPCFPYDKHVTPIQDGMAKLADTADQARAFERLGKIPETMHTRPWSQQYATVVANYKKCVFERHRRWFRAFRGNLVLRTSPMSFAMFGNRARYAQRLARQTYHGAKFHQGLVGSRRIASVE